MIWFLEHVSLLLRRRRLKVLISLKLVCTVVLMIWQALSSIRLFIRLILPFVQQIALSFDVGLNDALIHHSFYICSLGWLFCLFGRR